MEFPIFQDEKQAQKVAGKSWKIDKLAALCFLSLMVSLSPRFPVSSLLSVLHLCELLRIENILHGLTSKSAFGWVCVY